MVCIKLCATALLNDVHVICFYHTSVNYVSIHHFSFSHPSVSSIHPDNKILGTTFFSFIHPLLHYSIHHYTPKDNTYNTSNEYVHLQHQFLQLELQFLPLLLVTIWTPHWSFFFHHLCPVRWPNNDDAKILQMLEVLLLESIVPTQLGELKKGHKLQP